MKVRIILMSSVSGAKEDVAFTDDFESPAEDFCLNDMQVDDDDSISDMELPSGFPLNYLLHRD